MDVKHRKRSLEGDEGRIRNLRRPALTGLKLAENTAAQVVR